MAVVDDNVTVIGQGYHAVYHNIQTWRAYGFGVVSGGVVSPGSDGGVSVDVTSGTGVHDSTEGSIPSKTSLALASPDSTDPRKDLIVWNGSDVVDITGTPNPVDSAQDSATRFETYQPSPPDGTGQTYTPVVLAEVWVPAGATTINSGDINDLRTDPAVTAHGVTLTSDVQNEAGTVLLEEANGTVGDGTVDTAAVQADAVTSTEIAAGAVGTTQVASGAITATELDLSIAPTWTGAHTFDAGLTSNADAQFGEGASLVHDRDEITSTSATTDGSGYYLVDTDTAGGEVTLTLASADAVEGREVNIKRDGSHDVVIETGSTETIDGETNARLTQAGEAVTLVFNNADSDWEVW